MSNHYTHWTDMWGRTGLSDPEEIRKWKEKGENVFQWVVASVFMILAVVWIGEGWQSAVTLALIVISSCLMLIVSFMADLIGRIDELAHIYVFDRASQEQKDSWSRAAGRYREEKERQKG